jgi:hypothetical protein
MEIQPTNALGIATYCVIGFINIDGGLMESVFLNLD